jgi:hypothetical protein
MHRECIPRVSYIGDRRDEVPRPQLSCLPWSCGQDARDRSIRPQHPAVGVAAPGNCLRRRHLRCGLGHSMRLGDVEGAVPIASSAPTLVSFLEFDPPGRESCPLLGSDRRRAKDAVNQKRHLFRRLRQNIKETAAHAASAPYRPQCAQKIIGGRRNIVAAAARRCSNEPALTMIKDTLTSSFFCSAKPIR